MNSEYYREDSPLIMNPISRRSLLRGACLSAIYVAAKSLMPDLSNAEKVGGTLKVGLPAFSSLDPTLDSSFSNLMIANQIFDPLIRVKSDLTIEPSLFTSWESSNDFRSWTFRLRQGIKWHNGAPLTIDQVVERLSCGQDGCCNRQCPKSGSGKDPDCPHKDDCGEDMAVIKKDDDTIAVSFKKPMTNYLFHLGRPSNLLILPDLDRKHPRIIGTGPFKLESIIRDEKVIVVRNSEYWAYRPFLDKIEFHSLGEDDQIPALISGQVDLIPSINAAQAWQLKSKSQFKLFSIPIAPIVLHMNSQRSPFDDPTKRLALRLSINPQEIIENVFKSFGSVNSTLIQPGTNYYPQDFQATFNIEKCKHLMKSPSLKMIAPRHLTYMEPFIKFQTQLCGIDLNIEFVEGYHVIMQKAQNANEIDADIIMMQWYRPWHPMKLVEDVAASWSPWNIFKYDDKELDIFISRFAHEINRYKRQSLAKSIAEIMQDRGPVAVLGWKPQISAYRKNLNGYNLNQYGYFDGSKIWLD